jgi:hypothetical protein
VYPNLDSAVTSIGGVPPISRVVGFDQDAGVLAFIDDKGQPRRLDLRANEARLASKAKLTSIATVNGADLYAITPEGKVARTSPSGDWEFEPPSPARWVFPQPNGYVVIASGSKGKAELWLIRPTDTDILASASLPEVSRGVRTQLGDRLYFTAGKELIGVNTRDLKAVKTIKLPDTARAVAPTPSGDRLYVAVKGQNKLSVVDRYTEDVSEPVSLPGPAEDLRMDPLGQNLLARPAGGGDSVWVISVGSDKVTGTIRSEWRTDLPAFSHGSTIAAVQGTNVVMISSETLADVRTVSGGAADFWYFTSWNGFRPRPADLDIPAAPVGEPAVTGDSAGMSAGNDSIPAPPLRDASPTQIPPVLTETPQSTRYMVSFAAVLSQQKADETASGISVNGVRPHVVASQSGSTTLYRVVLGPYGTREEADRVGRDAKRQYWVYEVKE